MSENLSRELIDFIAASPDCWHAAANAAAELEAAGYAELSESRKWKIVRGGKYFVRRNLSALIAFEIPEGDFTGFMIAAAHGDSPCFRIKDNAEIEVCGKYTKLNVEKYGGMIFSTWLDRPLSVSGRVVVETERGIETRLVNIDRDLLVIPNVAIHMNRAVNEGYKLRVQEDMLPLIGDETAAGALSRLVAESAGVSESEILSSELFVYSRQPGIIWGASGEYMSSPRLDDQQCVFALLKGFLSKTAGLGLPVFALYDNEEVGSGTKQGAAATFLKDTLKRICHALELGEEAYMAAVANSFMLSADNAHAVHPNRLSAADITNRPFMNGGVVIKHSGEQKYTTDAVSAAMFRSLCKRAEVKTQDYYNNSDVAGGSTLGHISSAQVSVNMADIGIAQLAMHSAFETCGTRDTDAMAAALGEFFSSSVEETAPGTYTII